MITSTNVLGPKTDPTVTQHVYGVLIEKNGETLAVSLLKSDDQQSFDIQGRKFERTKERDEHSRIVFKEVDDRIHKETAPSPATSIFAAHKPSPKSK